MEGPDQPGLRVLYAGRVAQQPLLRNILRHQFEKRIGSPQRAGSQSADSSGVVSLLLLLPPPDTTRNRSQAGHHA